MRKVALEHDERGLVVRERLAVRAARHRSIRLWELSEETPAQAAVFCRCRFSEHH